MDPFHILLMEGKPMTRALPAAALTLFLMTAAGSAPAANLFVTPLGVGDCTQAAPCSLSEALDN